MKLKRPQHANPFCSYQLQISSPFGLSLPTVLLAVVLIAGIFFRIWQYTYDRSLWLDEAFLANNIVLRSFGELLLKPLGANQGAPLGFVLLLKSSTTFFGANELALRLVSLSAGLLSLFAAHRINYSFFNSTASRSCFLGLVAFSPILIYYSSELKQYSMDVAACLCILWIALDYRRWKHGIFLFALVGSTAVWLSHPSVFVLTAVGTVLLIKEFWGKEYKHIYKLIIVVSTWTAGFASVFFLSLRTLSLNKGLVDYWKSGYAPFPIRSPDDLHWFWESALGLIYLAFQQSRPADPAAQPDWFASLNIILLIFVLIGALCLYFKSKRLFGFIVLPILVTLSISAFDLYPFRNRLILFLTPLVYILAVSAADWSAGLANVWGKAAGYITAACLIMLVLFPSLKIAFNPYNPSDIKSALAYIQAESSPGDQLALSAWSCYSFSFYAKRFKLQDMEIAAVIPPQNDAGLFLNDLLQKQALKRTWIIFSHRFHERTNFLTQLRSVTPLLQSYEADSAGAYLFDFSNL